MRKKILLLTTALTLSLFQGTIIAQTTKKQPFVTTDMAIKISNYCQYNELMRDIFVSANLTYYNRESDRILRTLDTHLDYAEKFLLSLYNHYGLERSYFVLKDMGFTIQETDIVESVWKNRKDKLKQQADAEKKRSEEFAEAERKRLEKQREKEAEEEYSWDGKVYAVVDTYGIDDNKETQQQFENKVETRVDLNDYFGYNGTDWNYTELDDEESRQFFDSVLKKNGIYWSERLNCYVKKLKNTKEELQLEKRRQEEQRRQIEQLRRKNEEEYKRREEEQALLRSIEAGEVFSNNTLSVQPDVSFNMDKITTRYVINDKNEYMNYNYDCFISSEGKLSLMNVSDTLNYSTIQKYIYQYLVDNHYTYEPGGITINGKIIPVNSYFNIHFKERRYAYSGYLEVFIKKNKKTNRWDIIEESLLKIQSWAGKNAVKMRLDLESAINNCPTIKDLKGKMQLHMDVYRRVLSSNISNDIELSYFFKIKYRKISYWYVWPYEPLEYNVSF